MTDPIADVADYRRAARRRIPRFLFDYIDGGSYAEHTLHRNIADLAAVTLDQRVMRDVAGIDTTTRLFGQPMAMPLILAPVGLAGLAARRGEVQAARAASAAGIPFCLSTVSACSIEEVATGAGFWFQLYTLRDRGVMATLIDRAAAAGCSALVYTVDLPRPGARYRDIRSGLTGSAGWRADLRLFAQALARPGWAWDVGLNGRPLTLGNLRGIVGTNAPLGDFLGWLGRNFDPGATWDDLAWVRARWAGTLVVKGVLHPDDAAAAIDAGADGIVVSNHGGRQLDGAVSAVAALPAIVDRVGGRTTIFADGGVRSGLDILKLLSLGADGAMIGRPWAWALGARGERGVAHLVNFLKIELETAMALTGRTTLKHFSELSQTQ